MTHPMMPSWKFLPRRPLGRTGFVATIIGIGDIADPEMPREQMLGTLERAMDAGLNVIDTAPSYENGLSEEIVGEALQGRRESMFVVDKVDALDKPVEPQVDESLRRLGLPGVDLFVFHNVSRIDDWRRLSAPGGAMDELGECVRKGKAFFRGISSHDPTVVLDAIDSGLCDVVMFPVGPFCHSRYIEQCLPAAQQKGVGTICFKAFGAGKLLTDTVGYGKPIPNGPADPGGTAMPHMSVEECVRFTLTCDPDVALLGMSNAEEQDAAFSAAAELVPLTVFELDEMRHLATHAVEGKGDIWWDPVP